MALSPAQQSATSTRKPSAQSITPELRRWIIEQAQAGFSAPVVLQSMRDAGWTKTWPPTPWRPRCRST